MVSYELPVIKAKYLNENIAQWLIKQKAPAPVKGLLPWGEGDHGSGSGTRVVISGVVVLAAMGAIAYYLATRADKNKKK